MIIKVCDAAKHAYQRGIIHRDLKSGNTLVAVARANAEIQDLGCLDARICRSQSKNCARDVGVFFCFTAPW